MTVCVNYEYFTAKSMLYSTEKGAFSSMNTSPLTSHITFKKQKVIAAIQLIWDKIVRIKVFFPLITQN